MAHLLGSKNCMQSLSQDIQDTQTTLEDILIKVGEVSTQSWKFPDKIASDVEITELLEDYTHCNDEEFNRLSHIILFELVIDRLLFLLHAVTCYCENIIHYAASSTEKDCPKSKMSGSSVSVGLTVKKFWSKIAQVSLSSQSQRQKIHELLKHNDKLKENVEKLNKDSYMLQDNSSFHNTFLPSSANKTRESRSAKGDRWSKSIDTKISSKSLSKSLNITETQSKSEAATQTYETSFVPCEACAKMQQNLLDVGATVINVCESQGLPSSLAKQKKMLRKSLMAAADVSRWAAEQSRDLQRINKHLDNLYAQINPLQGKLKSEKDNCRHLEEKIKQCTARLQEEEKEKEAMRESHEKEISSIESQKEVVISEREELTAKLRDSISSSEKICAELGEKINNERCVSKKLEEENSRLLQQMLGTEEIVKELTDKVQQFEAGKDELVTVETKLETTKGELEKSRVENASLAKHDKTLQLKYDALLKRVDELDEECDELQTTMTNMEEEKTKLAEALQLSLSDKKRIENILDENKTELGEITAEKNSLKEVVKGLQSSLESMNKEQKESKNRLKLLANFPVMDDRVPTDYNKSLIQDEIEIEEDNLDIVVQMERQIQANEIRIYILESQNEKLRTSLNKLRDFQVKAMKELPQDRIHLWNDSRFKSQSMEEQHTQQSFTVAETGNISSYTGTHLQAKPTITRPTSSTKISERRQAKELGARIASASRNPIKVSSAVPTYEWNSNPAFAKEGTDLLVAWSSGRPKSGRTDRTHKVPRPPSVNMITCPDCDKMYQSQKDLNIHRSFCYGRQ